MSSYLGHFIFISNIGKNHIKHEAQDLITWGAIILIAIGTQMGDDALRRGQNIFTPLTSIDNSGGFNSPKGQVLTFFSICPYLVQKLLTGCHR